MVSSCAYSRFNTVSKSPSEADPLTPQSEQLHAQFQLFFFRPSFFWFALFNGTRSR